MIKDPPLLTIRRNVPRAEPHELASFAGVQTSHVVDTMAGRGALDHRIKPLAPVSQVLVGTAITCHCGPADNLALFAALATAKAGDILIAATDGFTATSVAGDLLMGMARNRGILGLVEQNEPQRCLRNTRSQGRLCEQALRECLHLTHERHPGFAAQPTEIALAAILSRAWLNPSFIS